MSERKLQNHPPGTLKSPENPAIPDHIYDMILDPDLTQASHRWTYQRKIPLLRAQYVRIFLHRAHADGMQTAANINITNVFSPANCFFAYSISMSSQYKYTHEELEKARGSKAKKYINLTKKGDEFFISDKKIIPVEDHSEFLKGFYDNPETSFQGCNRIFAKIAQDYVGISRRDIAKFLSNLETHQIHQKAVDVKISCPVVLRKEGTWAIDLTWLKEVDVESLTTVEKESQVVLTIVDCFSKYAWVRILPNKCAKTVSDAFRKILTGEHCSVIRSDNGSEFKSNEFKAVTTEFEIKHIFSDTYNPRQNAMIKRFNKTLKMTVYRYMTQ
jgi:hypothetical protein